MPLGVTYACAAMLFVGAAPLPYGYYVLLRLVACCVFACAAFVTFGRRSSSLPWIFCFVALLFNPLIKVPLPKEWWVFIDIAAALLLIGTAKKLVRGG